MTEVNLTKKELLLAAQLLKMAGETYSRNICSDFNLAEVGLNKEERLTLMEKVAAWSGDPEFRECISYEVQYDWMLMKCLAHELEKAVKSEKKHPQPGKKIDVMFDGPPGPRPGRFIEVEVDGKSVDLGEWVEHPGASDTWSLSFTLEEAARCLGVKAPCINKRCPIGGSELCGGSIGVEGATGPGLCPEGAPVAGDEKWKARQDYKEEDVSIIKKEVEGVSGYSDIIVESLWVVFSGMECSALWARANQKHLDEFRNWLSQREGDDSAGPGPCPTGKQVEATKDGEAPWYESMDAKVWAEQFVKHKKDNNWTLEDIDEDLMVTWFANALCTAHVQMRRQMEDMARSRDDAEKGLEAQNTRFNELENELSTANSQWENMRQERDAANKRVRELEGGLNWVRGSRNDLETKNERLRTENAELRELYAMACKRLKELGETEVVLQPEITRISEDGKPLTTVDRVYLLEVDLSCEQQKRNGLEKRLDALEKRCRELEQLHCGK